jgi:hypothetical protein
VREQIRITLKTPLDLVPCHLHSWQLYNVTKELMAAETIDLVLIDPQSVGMRTHDLMDTVNAKKRWKTICWRANKYLKYNHLLARFGKERASF